MPSVWTPGASQNVVPDGLAFVFFVRSPSTDGLTSTAPCGAAAGPGAVWSHTAAMRPVGSAALAGLALVSGAAGALGGVAVQALTRIAQATSGGQGSHAPLSHRSATAGEL